MGKRHRRSRKEKTTSALTVRNATTKFQITQVCLHLESSQILTNNVSKKSHEYASVKFFFGKTVLSKLCLPTKFSQDNYLLFIPNKTSRQDMKIEHSETTKLFVCQSKEQTKEKNLT